MKYKSSEDMKVGITQNYSHVIIVYLETDWSHICPLPSTTKWADATPISFKIQYDIISY